MVHSILALLQTTQTADNKRERLQEIAVRLEDYLWKRSPNMETYEDKATLRHRLQSLAVKMAEMEAVKRGDVNVCISVVYSS